MSTGGGPGPQSALSGRAAVMGLGTILSRATGFGRVFALAYALGFDRLADSYNLANTTPNIVYELVLGGILSATMVPVFVDQLAQADRRGDGERARWHGISAVVTLASAALVVLSALAFLAAPLIVRLYTLGAEGAAAADQRAVATALLRLFAPQVGLLGAITITAALLNAAGRFAAPMFSPVLANLVTIGVLLAFPHVASSLEVGDVRRDTGALLLLGLGTTAGYGLQALAQLPSLRRAGVFLRPVWDVRHEAVRALAGLAGWTLGVVVTNQLAYWVVLVLANRQAGDLSAYQAAYLFFQLPHAVVAVSIITALLPDLSRRWSTGDLDGFRQHVNAGLRTVAAILVPAAAGYALLGTAVVRLVLQHGRLAADSAETTGTLLTLFALGLPGFSCYLLLTRAFQAMRDTRTVFVLYAFENAVNVGLALLLHPILGVEGLAIAYAVAYGSAALLGGHRLRARLEGLDGAVLARSLLRTGVASTAMAFAVGLVVAGAGPAWLEAGAGLVAGVTVYLLVARLVGVRELTTVFQLRRRSA